MKGVKMENQEIDKKLESKNIKPTAMRTLVYKTLAESGKALSLADLEQRFEKAERSTIFRALKSFQDNYIVHTVDDGTGSVKYAVCDDECTCTLHDQHVHFYCTRCGRTRCMREMPISKIDMPEGFTYKSASFVVKGVCPICD
jgi:Fur family ferric uptake transcriptional regulator